MFTKPFQNLSKNDVALAGGKGASLGEMTQADIPVPPGFVVLSDAFEQFIKETDLNIEIDAKLHKVDHNVMHTVEEASEKIQSLILQTKMPEDIADEVQKEFKKLNTKYVAVRSSATAEDSSAAAWAGQLESFLNTTEENLLQNVRKCWASLFTPRAIFYRFEQNLHKQKISVAVVVQKMVESEKSGIAFSVHPVTQDRNQLIIEAGYGLGEAIVSGSITPDGYVVEKDPRRIIDKNINTQERKLARAKTGGNEWQDIPQENGEKSVLDDKQIMELSDLILKIEKHYKSPQDIEWAFEEGRFYITQSRPITTLLQINENNTDKIVVEKMFTREHSLFYCFVWNTSDIMGLKRWTNQELKNSIFIGEGAKKKLHVYYDPKDFETFIERIKEKVKSEPNFVNDVFNEFDTQWKYIFPFLSKEKEIQTIDDLQFFYDHFIKWWSPMAVVMNIPDINEIEKNIRNIALQKREETEKYSDAGDGLFVKFFSKHYPQYENILYVISPEEIFSLKNQPLTKEQISHIEERLSGYMVTNGALYLKKEIEKILKEKGVELEKIRTENEKEIKGTTAQGGKVSGRVRKLLYKDQINKLKEGEVLVTEMTAPDFLPAIKKSVAIVTDEGGITCHAAIVSRELGKPCIIGTKIATKVLKDGDEVEVDADNGVVRIIEKAK